ncbi:hypothetical protein ACFO5K_26160 [Nocardia halotolerans]|uniref:Uncharacterized protein n=1 Tax=Nocardia halotolerans TaxID=1755878 RepID=A0ABV8VPR0_9NOCA
MASTSLPLAAAAAVATLLAAPAGAVPSDQPTTPATPAPAQPGTENEGQQQPADETPETGAPEQTEQETPEKAKPGETTPTPAQPGLTTPAPDEPEKAEPTPSQPGLTTPRVAPLPVPGQDNEPQPAVHPGTGAQEETAPGQEETAPGQEESAPEQGSTPGQDQPSQAQPAPSDQGAGDGPDTLLQEPKAAEEPSWQAPRLANAPAAPVVEMEGPRQEVGVTVDGGALLPGVLANTHHYNNESGYVGTIGYRAPGGGFGDAGVSVEYITENSVKVTTFNGGDGRADNTTVTVLDTTQANLAKAAVENWIKAQPGGTAAMEAAAKATLPVPGELLQTINVAGVTTQWGGSLQY